MLACCRDTVTRSNGFKIIRSKARPISTHLASTGGALYVYSQEQRRRGGTTQQDATQSFCENSSASFKRSLNVKFVLRWGWVFFKSPLQNDVRRFGRGLAGLFSQQILLNLIKRCSNQHAEIFMNETNMRRFESVFTNRITSS